MPLFPQEISMRRVSILGCFPVLILAACSSGEVDGGSAETSPDTNTPANPGGAQAPLQGNLNHRIFGRPSLNVTPVYTVPLTNCGTLVGYTTGSEDGPKAAHVAYLGANDKLIQNFDVLPGLELRGLASELDGHFGRLIWDDEVEPRRQRAPSAHSARYNRV